MLHDLHGVTSFNLKYLSLSADMGEGKAFLRSLRPASALSAASRWLLSTLPSLAVTGC
jgi:hypothetical protein